MLHKTKGVVLKAFRHTETSLICRIYTEKFGLQSYLVQGARRKRARIPGTILQPFHILEMVVYHKENGNLQRISEARLSPVFHSIPYHIEKSTIALLLTEVMNKVIKLSEPDPPLFQFMEAMIIWFDEAEEPVGNFHLSFLLKLTKFLGFSPVCWSSDQRLKDTSVGASRQLPTAYRNAQLKSPLSEYWDYLFKCKVDAISELSLDTQTRRQLLRHIIAYYHEHIGSVHPLNSQAVLEAIWE